MKELNDFINTVAAMREAQKQYFKNRWPDELKKSKELERKVDQMIKAHKETENQTKLFDQ